jgi:hypothetical protein
VSAFEDFLALRNDIFDRIRAALEEDSHCKSYEGAMRIAFPSYFEGGSRVQIELDCYVLGPNRHYRWAGADLAEAVSKAYRDLRSWGPSDG